MSVMGSIPCDDAVTNCLVTESRTIMHIFVTTGFKLLIPLENGSLNSKLPIFVKNTALQKVRLILPNYGYGLIESNMN